ncbi:hypothetical protein MUN89_11880 [Halobacillus salinarum]|uniref:Sigma-X negative effector n=1 Tax=Halobacillus salinarum TaxID=2932257 RepID=A0ABY4EKS0_9BACI|nr:hypothetical protein [Halobacillus salinarum]UOQ42671.1 hypothetical protein MUN89_11880 [Halobacillus salinarum]
MKRNDEELKKLLKRLPKMEDTKSKSDWYEAVADRSKPGKRKKNPRLMPVLSTLAALLVLVIAIPLFLQVVNQNKQMHESSDSSSSSTPEESAESKASDDKAFTLQSKEAPQESSEELQDLLISVRSGTMDTSVYSNEKTDVIIPVTFVPESEKQSDQVIPITESGLSNNLSDKFKLSYDQKSAVATAQFFSKDVEEEQAFIEAVRWEAEPLHAEKIKIKRPEQSDKQSKTQEVKPVSSQRYIFQLYQYKAELPKFFIPVKIDEHSSMQQALDQLHAPSRKKHVSAAVPDHVELKTVDREADTLMIEVRHGKWADRQEAFTTLQAVLLTAKQFGYKNVKFLNMGFTELGGYQVNKPIEVPDSFNPYVKSSSNQ